MTIFSALPENHDKTVTVFDYLVLFVLVTSVTLGVLRGLVKEVLSLLGWVVAFVVATSCSEVIAPWLPPEIKGDALRLIVAFLILFVGVRILVGLLLKVLDALIKVAGLTSIDRSLGAVFGLARGLAIVLVSVLLCGMTDIPRQPLWKEALFSPLAEAGAQAVMPYLSGKFVARIQFG